MTTLATLSFWQLFALNELRALYCLDHELSNAIANLHDKVLAGGVV
jgi:hypothetical protein